jgi:hypothetical protein
VRVEKMGEAGKDVELNPAKRKLDVQRVRGFSAKADAAALKSWLAGRYSGLKPAGATPAELVADVNAKMNADADASPWFSSNYNITVLDEAPAKAHLTKTHSAFFDAGQTDGVQDFRSGERKLFELALQLLSDAALKLVRGITLIRQAVRLVRVVGRARRGKPAPVSYRPDTKLGGETFTTGTDRTVVLFDNMFVNDASLFIGDKASGSSAQPLPLSAMTIEHELGHVIGNSAKIQQAFNAKFVAARSKLKAAPATWYAKSDPGKEFFPEAFAIYNADPSWMLANLPDMHAWLETLSNTGAAPP